MAEPSDFLPLSEATFLVLVSLVEPRHGYGIMQAVSAMDGTTTRLGPGTLYGALTKLVDQGLIERAGESEHDGERRKVYTLTSLGRRVAELECKRLQVLARMGKTLLGVGA